MIVHKMSEVKRRFHDDASVVVVHSCFKSLVKRETHFFRDERAAKKGNNFLF